MMSTKEIYNIAKDFRLAISIAKGNREFHYRDRMSNFPRGCCDDACDLLAYYLNDRYGICTRQGNGVYRDGNEWNTTNHAWLIMEEGIFIDITGSQFENCAEIYVGEENPFYKNLEDVKIFDNYNIANNERLWKDYQIIIKYLEEKEHEN